MINVNLIEQICVVPQCDVISDTENVYTAQFTFSEEWAEYEKTAIYICGKTIKKILLVPENSDYYVSENTYLIPNEVIKANGFYISVVGMKDKKLYPSTASVVRVKHSGYTDKDETEDEFTESVYQQLLNSTRAAYIGENGNWFEYNSITHEFEDTGINASVTVDSVMSDTSENPVQNKVVNLALNGIMKVYGFGTTVNLWELNAGNYKANAIKYTDSNTIGNGMSPFVINVSLVHGYEMGTQYVGHYAEIDYNGNHYSLMSKKVNNVVSGTESHYTIEKVETTENKVLSITAASTDEGYTSPKAVYDLVQSALYVDSEATV